MDARTAPVKSSLEEFEPFCKWLKEEAIDTLEIHLQGFKKEQLRVQLNNLGVMRINGEHWVGEQKRTGFHKEITVPKHVKTQEIRAKFSNGILYITMPKHTPLQTPLQNLPKIMYRNAQENEPKTPKKTAEKEMDGREKRMMEKGNNGGKENEYVLKLDMKRMAVCVAVVFPLLVAIIAFLLYFRPSNCKI